MATPDRALRHLDAVISLLTEHLGPMRRAAEGRCGVEAGDMAAADDPVYAEALEAVTDLRQARDRCRAAFGPVHVGTLDG
jgi:hypothetical protein